MNSVLCACSSTSAGQWLRFALTILLCGSIGCRDSKDQLASDQLNAKQSAESVEEIEWVSDLVEAENLILKLTVDLSPLTESVNGLKLPSTKSRSMFADRVQVTPLISSNLAAPVEAVLETRVTAHKIGVVQDVSKDQLSLWQPLLEQIASFRHSKFYLVNGRFLAGNRDQFETQLNFEGLAKLKSGAWLAIHAQQEVTWRAVQEADKKRWVITDWQQTNFITTKENGCCFAR